MSKSFKPQSSKKVKPAAVVSVKFWQTDKFYWIVLGAIMLFVAFLRARLFSIPFERDEGEYAYMASLILDGIPPYKEAYNMKLPGTYYVYAFFMMLFGRTVEAVHIGLMVVNLGTMFFTFLLGRLVFNRYVGLMAAVCFGLMSFNHTLLGFAAHATQFVIFPAIAGIYYLLLYKDSEKIKHLFISGLLLGTSFLMKQQAAVLLAFAGVCWLLIRIKNFNFKLFAIHGIMYAVSVLLPYLLIVLLMYVQGVFDKFWFWTFSYAQKYASGLSFAEGKQTFDMMFGFITNGSTILWWLATFGCVALFFSKWGLEKKIFGALFIVFSFLSVCPGLYFRNHYWILLLPALGMAIGFLMQFANDIISKKAGLKMLGGLLPALILLFIFYGILNKDKYYYFKNDPVQLSRIIYGVNPFPEAVKIAKYIEDNSRPEDKIAILGSEPEIFFYSNRKSASGYIYTYGLVEQHDYNLTMQQEMIKEVEEAQPEYLIFCRVSMSWLVRPNTPDTIFKWYEKYSQQYYNLVGIVDIMNNGQSVYKFNQELQGYKPQAENSLFVFRRKEEV